MGSIFWVPPTPLDEFGKEGVYCAGCEMTLTGEACFDGESDYYCEPCMSKLVEEWADEAAAYAEEHCRITRPLPRYDPAYEYRCTPEEYAAGAKESYTANAHLAFCRHHCTNYDELLRPLDRSGVRDQIYYDAIRDRIMDLLDEAIDEMAWQDDEEDDAEEGV